MDEGNLPLGICKQAALKLDAFLTDIAEIEEDEGLDEATRDEFHVIRECGNMILSSLLTIVMREIDEEDFTGENVQMDDIEDLFASTDDVGDIPI